MAKTLKNLQSIAALRVNSTALTVDTNGTELTDARLASWRAGLFICVIGATDVASADETYALILEGRKNSTDAFTTMATITKTFAADPSNTIAVENWDGGFARIRFRLDVGGTTPSIIVHAFAQALEFDYQPDVGTIITT